MGLTMIQLRDLCKKYGRDKSAARKALIKRGLDVPSLPEYFGGQNVNWVHEHDLPAVIAYLTKTQLPDGFVAPVAEPVAYEPALV